MKIVLSVDKDRIAPVFDVARDFICCDQSEPGQFKRLTLRSTSSQGLIFALAEFGAEVLICGAISRPLQLIAEGNGIIVYGFLTGNISEIMAAFTSFNTPDLSEFCMPGCGPRKRQRRQQRRGACRVQNRC